MKRRMREQWIRWRSARRRPALGVFLVLGALSVAGCAKPAAEGEEEHGPLKPVPVEAVVVQPMTLRPTLNLIGTIVAIPERTAVVSSQLGGWVQQLAAVEGQAVHRGDTLVKLDPRAAQADADRAQALVDEKAAALARVKRGYLPEEIEGVRQDRDKARAAADGLRGEFAALEQLAARQEISQVQLETRQKALDQATATLAAAEARLKQLEAGNPREVIDEAQAQLDAARADLEHAKLAVQWCTVTSPSDGVVVQLLARQGQFFERAAILATIMDLTEVFVQLRVPSLEFGKLSIGTPVGVDLAAAGQTLHGTLARFSGDADPLTGNVVVFASLQNTTGRLRPGMGCNARVWLPEIADALAVPAAAVADHDGKSVVTVIRDGKAYETPVDLGPQAGDVVQVVQGLSAGDTLATVGGYGLPEGCPVSIVAHLHERGSAADGPSSK